MARVALAGLMATTVGATLPSRAAEITALIGGRVIDGYGGIPLDDALVVIEGHKILRVGALGAFDVPAGARRIDVHGMTIMPGLWESDGHLALLGEGVPAALDGERSASRLSATLAAAAKTSLLAGVTSYRDCGGPLDEEASLRRQIVAGQAMGPRLLLAGPALRQTRDGDAPAPVAAPGAAHDPYAIASTIANAKDAVRVVDALKARGVDLLFVNGVWDVEVLRALVTTAHRDALRVDAAIRHVSELHAALSAGVDNLHHLFTADPLSGYSDEDWRRLVGGDGGATAAPYVLPTIEMRNAYVRAFDYPGFIDDPRPRQAYSAEAYQSLRASWAAPTAIPWGVGARERVGVAFDKVRLFIAKGGSQQLIAGTDAGSPLNLHSPLAREIRNLQRAGLSAMEAIQSATLRPAKAQGMLDRVGTVTPGKWADLLIVDGDPLEDLSVIEHRVALVIKDGVAYLPPPRTPLLALPNTQ